MEVISKTKILGDGDIELSPEAKEKLKKLVGKTVGLLCKRKRSLPVPFLNSVEGPMWKSKTAP